MAESEPVFDLTRRRRRGSLAKTLGLMALILVISTAGFVAGYWSGSEAPSAARAYW